MRLALLSTAVLAVVAFVALRQRPRTAAPDLLGTWTAEGDGLRFTIEFMGNESGGPFKLLTEISALPVREWGKWSRTAEGVRLEIVSSPKPQPIAPRSYRLVVAPAGLVFLGPVFPTTPFRARQGGMPALYDDDGSTTVEIDSFDPDGRAWLTQEEDGSLSIAFEFMPPLSERAEPPDHLGRFRHFDREMADAIGADVFWEDREVFRIKSPAPDTTQRLREFARTYEPASGETHQESPK